MTENARSLFVMAGHSRRKDGVASARLWPSRHPRLPFLPGSSSMVGGTAQAPLPHLADRRSTVARSALPRTINTGNRTLFASMVAGHLLKRYKTVGCIRRCVARKVRLQGPAGLRDEVE